MVNQNSKKGDKMIEFLLENLFSIVADMTLDKIRQLKEQYTNQQILYTTICQYVGTDWFKTEYRDVAAVIEKDKLLAIESDDISPTKSAGEIVECIEEVLDGMLVTDDVSLKKRILTAIATQYLSKRELAIGLFDILEKQKEDTDKIIAKIDDVDRSTLLVADSVQKRETLRERAIKSGIGMKMGQFINETAESYISIVTNDLPHPAGSPGGFNQYMSPIREQIAADFPNITVDFINKSVPIIIPDPNGTLMPVYKDVDALLFLDLFSKKVHAHIDELMKYSNLLPDEFIIKMIELTNIVDSDINTQAVKRGFAQIIRLAIPSNAEESVRITKSHYKILGEKLLEMEPYTKWN